jgi:hypothetical protein
MSGVISVGVAVRATALTATDIAAAGLTIGTALEATAAVAAADQRYEVVGSTEAAA